jgi:hypothetical protein
MMLKKRAYFNAFIGEKVLKRIESGEIDQYLKKCPNYNVIITEF